LLWYADIISKQLGSPFPCEHTNKALCDEVYAVAKASLSGDTGSESSSVLIFGDPGSGKSHAVEQCLSRLRQDPGGSDAVVLRAHGGAYHTDVECMRHLATQVSQQVQELPSSNASFEQSMDWLRAVLKESFKQASAAVIILDRFEHFCSRNRQTLLYNLFDVAQEAGVRICIIGTSERLDVMGQLEKRIKSRFSMRHALAFRPTKMEDLVRVLMSKLRLPEACGLNAAFVREFNEHLEAALRKRPWQPHLDFGRPPSWFLARCVPAASMLHEHLGADAVPPAKRAKKAGIEAVLPSSTRGDEKSLFVRSLSEVEHVVLIALFRQRDRGQTATLRTTLHEIEGLHRGGRQLVYTYVQDIYTFAFNRLVQMKLVHVRSLGNADVGKLFMPCESAVHGMYEDYVCDLEKANSAWSGNPLRALPGEVQKWSARQKQ